MLKSYIVAVIKHPNIKYENCHKIILSGAGKKKKKTFSDKF